MITKIEVTNFRNIKHWEADLSKTNIIVGANNLGKSNRLNALSWALTDTLLTDKWGAGENDTNSIIPNNQLKGENTTVTITLDTGAAFTKVYKTGYDRATGKANKHTTEGLINNVPCKNMAEWTEKLQEALDFEPIFKNVNEPRLFTDPLYALQKLEAKDLRLLLVALGCKVTNEELYALGFEDLKPYEKKYLGDFTNMRIDLKKHIKEDNEAILKADHQLETVNDAEEFDDARLKSVRAEISRISGEIDNAKKGDNSSLLKELELEISTKKVEADKKLSTYKAETNEKIHDLEFKIYHEKELETSNRDKEVSDLNSQIANIDMVINSLESSIISYNQAISNYNKHMAEYVELGKASQQRKANYSVKLQAEKDKEYNGLVTCPNCGEQFVANEEDYEKFNSVREANISEYTREIESCKTDETRYLNELKSTKNDLEKAKSDKAEAITNLDSKKAEKAKLEELKELAEHKSIKISPKRIEYENSLEDYEKALAKANETISPELEEIERLTERLTSMKQNMESANVEKIAELNTQLYANQEVEEEELIKKSKWLNKCQYMEDRKAAVEKLNDDESLLSRVNEFIHKMIETINKKAAEKTGINFVMLEENLSNDGIKEVCYATVDGIPFANVNTSEKIVCGVKFIEKIKDIVVNDFGESRNTLPILADRLEGFDYIEKIENLTTEQLICTRVGENKEIEVRH